MNISIEENARVVLQETRRLDTPEQFQTLLDQERSEMDLRVHEPMVPNQPIDTTLVELHDAYALVREHATPLAKVKYGPERQAQLCIAIRLLDTAHVWFGEGKRQGAYRPRSVEATVQASRPWRARINAIAQHALVFEPELAERFAYVNTTGTLDEEKSELAELNDLVKTNRARLAEYGLTDELVAQGKTLAAEADGRDLLGILGLRTQDDALALRDKILSYAVLLGHEAQAAGVNAFFGDEAVRSRFEASSIRNALRRLRPRRRRAVVETPGEPGGGGTAPAGTPGWPDHSGGTNIEPANRLTV
jgi:hypothetical protein